MLEAGERLVTELGETAAVALGRSGSAGLGGAAVLVGPADSSFIAA